MKEVGHRQINAVVVCRGEDDDLADSPDLADDIGRMCLGDIIDLDILAALSAKFCCKCLSRRSCMSIQRSVDDNDSVVFRLILAPLLIFVDEPCDVLASPDRSVQRADELDVDLGSLLQDGLYLCAVLADDICIIPSRVIEIVLLEVVIISEDAGFERAECAERVCGEECACRCVICEHSFRPVDHRSHDECKCMRAGRQCISLFDDDFLHICRLREVVLHHLECLDISDQSEFRMHSCHCRDLRAVVRLHMKDNEVIKRTAVQRRFKIFEILV